MSLGHPTAAGAARHGHDAGDAGRPRLRGGWRALELLGWLALCAGAAALGALALPDTWYRELEKPRWQPPDAVFGPVWTLLYSLMALAAWIVAGTGWRRSRVALALFAAQLAVNAAWSPLFFRLHLAGAALIDLTALLALLAATIAAFARRSRAAAWLLAPYAAWCAYAWTLNAAIWWLDR